MKYIDKSNEISANLIIDRYLKFARRQPWYSAEQLYKGFRGSRGKHRLIDSVLLPEQFCRCCYCQKHLYNHTDSDVTIEHIIRQGIPDALSMQSYFNPQFIGLNSRNVCHTDDYVNNNRRPKPYPHKVAYHNFAVACKKCNSVRGHQDIDPPFLFPHIEQEVAYDRLTGKVKWNNDPFVPTLTERFTLDKLELNTPLLKAMRAIWIFGKDHPVRSYSTPDTVSTLEQRRDLIYRTMAASASNNRWFSLDDQDAFISLMTDELWRELLKYDYFANV